MSPADPSDRSPALPAPGGVGFAVAGLGKMGIMHAAMISAIPGGRVAALVDRNARVGHNVRSMGVDAPLFTDLEACLDAVRPEGVWIATPQSTHRPLIERCLQRGVPVFSEKPLAHTLEDALAIAQAAAARPDVPVAVGYMLAFNPLFDRAAQWLADGAIGELRAFKASCRLSQVFRPMRGWTFDRTLAGGGVLINSGCHLLYVLDRLFGPPRRASVAARGVHNEVEDVLHALVEFPSGLFGTVEVTWSVPGYETQTHDVEVIGTEGLLQVNHEWLRVWRRQRRGEWPAGWSQHLRHELEPRAPFTLSPDYCGDEFYLEDADFIDAVRHRRPPRAGLDLGVRIQRWLELLYRALARGGACAWDDLPRGPGAP